MKILKRLLGFILHLPIAFYIGYMIIAYGGKGVDMAYKKLDWLDKMMD